MASPEDLGANAEYIRLADEVVKVPGGTNNNNYANVNLICEIAERMTVDAVMPMWGHASENPELPTSLAKLSHRVTFIGPPASAQQALGDKIGSTIIAQSAGTPTIAWNGDDLRCDYRTEGIPDSVYAQANVTTPEDALMCADRIGYPVMIKASEGGGGKGIRKVTRSEDVPSLFRQVQGEIPGSPIFVMKMASGARHLEVQLLADQHGDAIALSGRDCSVQRRHQKIIEEGPPTAADDDVRDKMEKAAVALAKTVGYANAGTVEYLFVEETKEFAFLELNPRLQVEHPVTENILGLNLPSCQVQVAMGIPLHRIADIRKLYGRDVRGRDTIDFEFAPQLRPERHCIAVRVTAENPEQGFQPTSGLIKELQFRSHVDVWGYFSVNNSGKIHEFADSQFGHIFASGRTREAARRAMVVALKELEIRGDIRTTIEYIVKLLQSDDFAKNTIDTTWLDGRIANHAALEESERHFLPSDSLVALCGSSLEGFRQFEEMGSSFLYMLSRGQVPNSSHIKKQVDVDLIYRNTKYSTQVTHTGETAVLVRCNDDEQQVRIQPLADGGFLLTVGGCNHTAYTAMDEATGTLRMTLDGFTCIFTPEYDPTRLQSDVAGKIARLLVPDGAHLTVGDPYVEIEVMKMYMPLKAQEAGTVHFQMSEGATLNPGDVIATVSLDDPDKVIKADAFRGILSGERKANHEEDMPVHVRLRAAQSALDAVLRGFTSSTEEIEANLATLLECIASPMLPVREMDEALAVLKGRIDLELHERIAALNNDFRDRVCEDAGKEAGTYPFEEILVSLHKAAAALPIATRSAFNAQIKNLWDAAESQVYPAEVRKLAAFIRMIEDYLRSETLFDSMAFTDVVRELRKTHSGDPELVLATARSHLNLNAKNVLMLLILDEIKGMVVPNVVSKPRNVPLRNEAKFSTRNLKVRLRGLSELKQAGFSHVSFAANLLLMQQYAVTIDNRRGKLHEVINEALTSGDPLGHGDRLAAMKKFAESSVAIRDLTIESLQLDIDYQIAFIELYLRKVYQKTHIMGNMTAGCGLALEPDDISTGGAWLKFDFFMRSAGEQGKEVEGVDVSFNGSPQVAIGMGLSRTTSFSDMMQESRDAAIYSDSDTEDGEQGFTELMKKPSHKMGRACPEQTGIFAVTSDFTEARAMLSAIVNKVGSEYTSHGEGDASKVPLNVAYVAVMRPLEDEDGQTMTEDSVASCISTFLKTPAAEAVLVTNNIRRITFLVATSADANSDVPTIYTFRASAGWTEDRLYRHIEAPQAFLLDLGRLSNFDISLVDGLQTSSGNVHLYKATPKGQAGLESIRYFARLVSFTADTQYQQYESLFVEALDHLALVIGDAKKLGTKMSSSNHIFLNMVAPDNVVSADFFVAEIKRMSERYSDKMLRYGVASLEIKLTCRLKADSEPIFMRLIASNPTGYVLRVERYYEAFSEGQLIFKTLDEPKQRGEWHGQPTDTPYPVTHKFELKRAAALASTDTLYVYDWPLLFEEAVSMAWSTYAKARKMGGVSTTIPPRHDMVDCKELVLCHTTTSGEPPVPLAQGWDAWKSESDDISQLYPMEREAGANNAGMVCWVITMKTPECPDGRSVVLIANDITFQAGSFGTREDIIFHKASRYARKLGIPRLYLAANSGARIGMAQSLKMKFEVKWNDALDPSKGFQYLYFTPEIHDAIQKQSTTKTLPFTCEEVQDENLGRHYKITDIIGEEEDLGVENLMGSGLIAGETSRAYDDIFTLTLVVGRTVGIGAYLVRLGQRTIQRNFNAPIILTGYQALNKLMGRDIYTTNDQLGGPMIMFPNGVSHLLSETQMDVVANAVQWLSFVPKTNRAPLPVLDIQGMDSIERPIKFHPVKGVPYDPRCLLSGTESTDGTSTTWESGFFDHGSFVETLSGWAKTVVVGRARLGGIPMGVIVTENRTSEALQPADPADLSSQEMTLQQAGGVWFPDSAYKTAQALKDFNREGLPCMVFANWRGFSGGQRDMFNEVLKFGSMIVDALVDYTQPIFVYIPPHAELRGGAWVVVDSTINKDVMEFYAAEDARGGVLEPAGAASIKFRTKDVLAAAHRLDPELQTLSAQLKTAETADAKATLSATVRKREKMLMGVYSQVAVHFADLHDTPGRMHAKGVIRQQVAWKGARSFFYWRLRRRLTELDLVRQIATLRAGTVDPHKAIDDFNAWYVRRWGNGSALRDDKQFMTWLSSHPGDVQAYLSTLRDVALAEVLGDSFLKVASAGAASADATNIVRSALEKVPVAQRDAVRATMMKALS